ncbi:MAG: cytochrome o ubiquinol oxidase subunit II [Yersinia sp. (in: enterobacteria)]
MRLKKYIKKIGVLSLFAATVMLSGCDMILMNPKGAIGVEQKTLILTAIGLMLIVVIPVIFMAFAFAWKFRASNKSAIYTPNWSHSNKIELVVWAVPIIIIAILATITWKTSHQLDPFKSIQVAGKEPITIEVVSLDWKWLFIYPEQGIATVNELAFPTDVPVNFKITSNSVMNSFFIPQLGGQIYAMAGMQTKLHLIANEAGKYNGISSSFSGKGFSGMKFTAIATPTQEDFNQWVAQVKKSPNTLKNNEDFNKLAEPSENNPVEYFSSVKPALFKDIIGKFMGDMNMHKKGDDMHKSMEMNPGMDMGEHAAHAGAEE